jgi:hypothetical protein
MARDLYVASWEKAGGPAWVARHGLTSAGYQAAFDQFVAQGYRLRCVSGYTDGSGAERYAGLWDKSTGGAWVARHGMTAAQYQAEFDAHIGQGYRLKLVNGHAAGGQAIYAAIWEKDSGPAFIARHGMTSSAYQTEFNTHIAAGFRLRWVSVYAIGGQDRYAAIWDKGTGAAWVAHHGQSETAFRTTSVQLAAQGYDLICAGAATVGSGDLYAGLWEKNAVASVAHHGMTSGTYQLKFEQQVAQGFRLRFVAGYSGVDPVDVVLRFTMQQQQQSNWCWAATSVSIDHFYNSASTSTQCSVANAQIGRTDCCGTGATGPCNIYGFLDDALSRVGRFASSTGSTTSFADTEAQLLLGRPLGIRVAWSGGGAHFVAATGTEDDSFVYVSDCGSGTTSLVDYATLKTAYRGSGTWTNSYFTQP